MTLRILALPVAISLLALAAFAPVAAIADEFPVSVDHIYGPTIIPAAPVRVVTLGWMTQDIVADLGIIPVGTPKVTWGDDGTGLLPWFADTIAAIAPERSALLSIDDGIPFEDILALDPDVILAPMSGIDENDFARLSSIAPTVAYEKSAWDGRWQDVTMTIGKALGKTAEAEQLIADTNAAVAAERAAHPEFADRTAIFSYIVPGSGIMHVYSPDASRVQMLVDLGFSLPPEVSAATDGIDLSTERLATIDTDVLVAWHNEPEEIEYVKTDPVYSRYRPVAEGHYVGIADPSMVMAVVAPSPSAIRWSLQILVNDLAEVLKN
ncbi:ABC transporter substrate-binding protein [Devosia sp. 2618]|uniref:ABC transporter substrate-binding protein n=1 Tax=Devosia sp. 2618 TaxID=3156454 RepID=UPI00339161AE